MNLWLVNYREDSGKASFKSEARKRLALAKLILTRDSDFFLILEMHWHQ